MLAYLNGRFLPFAEAGLPLHDAGFVSGATVVDNLRTFGGKLFRWKDHLARFRRDCEACFVPLEASDAELTAAAEELVARNGSGRELQLVSFATPGPLGVYRGEAANGPPTLGMATYPLPFARYRRFFTEGAVLAVVGHQPADGSSLLPPQWKHRSRMVWHIAEQLAKRPPHPPGAVALLEDRGAGTVTETAIANVLAVKEGVVVSPPRDRILDGLSLRLTHELCEKLGIAFEERLLPPSELETAEEVLLTGTAFGVAGVRMVNGIELAWPGPVFRKLLAAWSQEVGLDLEAQFRKAAE